MLYRRVRHIIWKLLSGVVVGSGVLVPTKKYPEMGVDDLYRLSDSDRYFAVQYHFVNPCFWILAWDK